MYRARRGLVPKAEIDGRLIYAGSVDTGWSIQLGRSIMAKLQPQMNLYLAEAYLVAGRFEEGLKAVDEGSGRAIQFEERAASAELHRVRGELLVASGHSSEEEIEVCFLGALDLAREQQAKTFELRAATSLARLWSDRGERKRAHELLAPVYCWFFEGFGTRDLIEAKALLDAFG
jgi:predicted ATPase